MNRSFSPHSNKDFYSNENPEFKKKSFKNKHNISSKGKENPKKSSKPERSDRSYEHKRKKENDYSRKSASRKFNRHQKDFSNERHGRKYTGSDSDNDYRDKGGFGIKYSKVKEPPKRSKKYLSRNTPSDDYSSSEYEKKEIKIKRSKKRVSGNDTVAIRNEPKSKSMNLNNISRPSIESYGDIFPDSNNEGENRDDVLNMQYANVERARREFSEYSDRKNHTKEEKNSKYKKWQNMTVDEYKEETFPKYTHVPDPYDSNNQEYDFKSMKEESSEDPSSSSEDDDSKRGSGCEKSEGKEERDAEDENDEVTPNYLRNRKKFLNIIARSVWDPEPGSPDDVKLPQQPFNHINYVDTGSMMCFNKEDCIDALQFLKEQDKGVKYNFYIGSDNLIYEGKGWVADVNEETGYRKRALDIAFMGVFSAFSPHVAMLVNSFHLVKYGMTIEKIVQKPKQDYKMY